MHVLGAHALKVSFYKIAGILKKITLLKNGMNLPFTSKVTHQKDNAKLELAIILFKGTVSREKLFS